MQYVPMQWGAMRMYPKVNCPMRFAGSWFLVAVAVQLYSGHALAAEPRQPSWPANPSYRSASTSVRKATVPASRQGADQASAKTTWPRSAREERTATLRIGTRHSGEDHAVRTMPSRGLGTSAESRDRSAVNESAALGGTYRTQPAPSAADLQYAQRRVANAKTMVAADQRSVAAAESVWTDAIARWQKARKIATTRNAMTALGDLVTVGMVSETRKVIFQAKYEKVLEARDAVGLAQRALQTSRAELDAALSAQKALVAQSAPNEE
jgi:hypothetical protein